MRSSLFLLILALLVQPGIIAGQTSPPEQLAASLLPLPETLRGAAGVRQVSPSGGISILRPSTNGMMCTADRPGDEQFDVRCYHVEFLAVMDYVRSLRQQGVPDSALDSRLRDAAQQGLIQFPATPTAGYRMLGPITGFDAATTTTTAAIDKWQSVHFPFRTAAEIGLPVIGDALMPYVMASGTWWSHVMIVHSN